MVVYPSRFRKGVRAAALGTLSAAAFLPCESHAQSISTQVFETTIPFTYNRGRNESVTDRERPEFDPVGINLGGFTALPSLGLSGGYNSNVYQSSAEKKGTGILVLSPDLKINSSWSVHALQLRAGGNFIRNSAVASRNENGWNVGARGRLDIGPDMALNIGAGTRKIFDTAFSATGVPVSRDPLGVQATLVNALADFKFTRVRLAVAADHSIYDFSNARALSDNSFLDRQQFDRTITRGTGHVEYGLTPDAGLFVQSTYTDTNYRRSLANGGANRDSHEIKVLGGASFDVSALMRGSIGVGYVKRSYRSAAYQDIKGVSVSGKLEYFPSQLTTVTFVLRRDIEDSTIPGTSGYFNNGAAIRIDHELLRNLLLNVAADYEHDKYRGIGSTVDLYRMSGGAAFTMSPAVRLDANLSYRDRGKSSILGDSINEFRGTVGITLRR